MKTGLISGGFTVIIPFFFFFTNMQKAENEYDYIYLEILNNQKTKQAIQSKHKIKNYNQIKF